MMKIYTAIMLTLLSGGALANYAPNAAELKSLPAYCTPRVQGQGNNPAGWAAGKAQFGEGWDHMHHYCFGLNFINRYYRSRDAAARKHLLNNAFGDINYMLTHTSESYFMRGQFMLDKGRVMILQGNKTQGLSEVQRALSFDPTLEAGYRFLADNYLEMGKKGDALKWVSTGLRYVPESRALQRRYKELGGKEPFPEPLSKPDEQTSKAPQENHPESTKGMMPREATQSQDRSAEKSAEQNTEPGPVVVDPKIGSPKNPYCRFCPD